METPILDSSLDFILGLIGELESGPFASEAVWTHEMAMAQAALVAVTNLKQAMKIASNEVDSLIEDDRLVNA